MVKEEIDSIEGEFWKKAMDEEMKSLRNNDTWDLVSLPNGRKKIGSKWVLKRQTNAVGHVEPRDIRKSKELNLVRYSLLLKN